MFPGLVYFGTWGERRMRFRMTWLGRLLSVLVLFSMIGLPIASAQDASPEASPIIEESTPGASPIVSPEASPVAASCTPGPSKTSAEVRTEIEEQFPIEQPANTEGTYVTGSVGDLQSVNPYIVEEATSLAVVGLVFDSFLGGDPNTGQPVPGGVTDYWEL